VKISVNATSYAWSDSPQNLSATLAETANAVDERPFDTLWVPDHLLQADPNLSLEEPMLEAFTTLGYLAAVTSKVRLGTLVGWASIRPPAVVVKAVTTLDVLTHGRAWLGVGAGYHEAEAAMMGLPFPGTARRFEHLEDVLRLAQQMWEGDESMLRGQLHTFERPVCSPMPIARRGPSVLIGGMGEKRTLPLVARYGDACNLFDIPDEGVTLTRKLRVLARECEAIGRDFGDIEITVSTRLQAEDTAASFAEKCRRLTGYGVDHAIVLTPGPWTESLLDILAAAADEVA
jgi:alkanesulfonate monooxygenase SsuD/methylene tetrahydromethanopterin reductase-like flavin-dependent oxidoreductase (luciferase family)